MSSVSPLVPTVLILNRKFRPAHKSGPHPCGASLFAIRASDVLRDQGIETSVILYNRVDGVPAPRLSPSEYFGSPAVEMDFCFENGEAALRAGMAEAFTRLVGNGRRAVAYFQTDVLLPFCPGHAVPVVTHHGPFADLLVDAVGADLAAASFGNQQKLWHLAKYQRAGIEWLRQRRDARALEISRVQEQFLLSHKVGTEQIFHLPPPLHDGGAPPTSPGAAVRAVAELAVAAHPHPVFATASARLDDFKNAELVVDAVMQLFSGGAGGHLLVIGGAEVDERRELLRASIPERFRARATFLPKLPHDELMACFAAVSGQGVFVCASRFETCGFTPLEAAVQGLLTVVPNSVARVEASAYFPASHRFEPNVAALAAMLSNLIANRHIVRETEELCRSIRERVSTRRFAHELLAKWRELSHPSERQAPEAVAS